MPGSWLGGKCHRIAGKDMERLADFSAKKKWAMEVDGQCPKNSS